MTQLAPSISASPHPALTWVPVCKLSDLLPGGGVCALVGGQQIAVFSVAGRLFAVSNFDPFTRANVLSRGLTGSYTAQGQERYKVVSPLLKHAFDLETGCCLSDPGISIAVYEVRAADGRILIGDAWTGSAD
ncbi:nitrite reductase small subunit NirD (plasmid) [Deinococcus sp. KNUC1210]|uniref:nitrite reductase small subunit NirD n=1 Tax=Deinococcus sp. KNUC1210 TaxID=2917691 RepID=UPI001EF00628|nr:nitrite reductase small subunit NirD [Deinococcus sp. KNUC1210]ULH17196.1 nitrite reductase small subunit NirD [Deinococcus sp. KNUC1210]